MTLESGLTSGLRSGLTTGLNPSWSSSPTTLQGFLQAADPMQALIDAMGFATKPDYMWGGDEAAGSTEIGGSGFDLTNTGCSQQQAGAAFGAGDFTVTNSNTDNMGNTTDGALQPGTGSFAALHVAIYTDVTATAYMFGDRDITTGWATYHQSAGQFVLLLDTPTGGQTVSVAGHSQDVIQVFLVVRNVSTATGYLHTSQATGTIASMYTDSCSSGIQKLAVGDTGAGNAAKQIWGMSAMWKGAVAEGLLATHRDALAAALGAG